MSQQVNFFNPAFVPRRQHFSLTTMAQGLGLLLLGSALMYGYAYYQVGQLTAQAKEGARRLNDEQLRVARFAEEFSAQGSDQLLQAEIQKLETQVNEQAELVAVMQSAALGNSAGYSEYMRAFSRQVVRGLWLTGFTLSGDGTQVSLSGGVVNPDLLPEYIQRLRREAVMQGKTFSALQMQQAKADKSGAVGHYVEFVLHSSAAEGKQ